MLHGFFNFPAALRFVRSNRRKRRLRAFLAVKRTRKFPAKLPSASNSIPRAVRYGILAWVLE